MSMVGSHLKFVNSSNAFADGGESRFILKDIILESNEFRDAEINFIESLYSLRLSLYRYKSRFDMLRTGTTPELEHYTSEIIALEKDPANRSLGMLLEFLDVELDLDFQTFLISAKSTLDKYVSILNCVWGSKLHNFSDKGKKITNYLAKSKLKNAQPLIDLLSLTKTEWLDFLIARRDDFAHYRKPKGYMSFWYVISGKNHQGFKGMQSLNPPVIGSQQPGVSLAVLDYMIISYKNLMTFLATFTSVAVGSPLAIREYKFSEGIEGCQTTYPPEKSK